MGREILWEQIDSALSGRRRYEMAVRAGGIVDILGGALSRIHVGGRCEKDKMAALKNEETVEEICASMKMKQPMVNRD